MHAQLILSKVSRVPGELETRDCSTFEHIVQMWTVEIGDVTCSLATQELEHIGNGHQNARQKADGAQPVVILRTEHLHNQNSSTAFLLPDYLPF